MRCVKCGFNYPEHFSVCVKCNEPRRSNASASSSVEAPSTLIEFPLNAMRGPQASDGSSAPWRAELSEKVRAVQARRRMEAKMEAEQNCAQGGSGDRQLVSKSKPIALPDDRPANPIVEAALNRVKRASEKAAKYQPPTLPVTSPHRGAPHSGQSAAAAIAPAPSLDRASQREVSVVASTAVAPQVSPLPANAEQEHSKSETGGLSLEKSLEHSRESSETDLKTSLRSGAEFEEQAVHALEEEPEILDDRAPLFLRFAATIVDLFVLAIANIPFVAVIELASGNFSDRRIQITLSVIAAVLILLYAIFTVAIGGRTLGMAVFRLRIVNAETGRGPSFKQSLLRAFGYMIAIVPAMIGILWIAFDRERRGWHDHLSGTIVVREFY